LHEAIQNIILLTILLISAALMVHMTEVLGINVHKALHIQGQSTTETRELS